MPTPGGGLVTKSNRTEFRSEKTGNKMVKSVECNEFDICVQLQAVLTGIIRSLF